MTARRLLPPQTWAQLQADQQRARALRLGAALERNAWSGAATARELGVGVSTLQSLIETHGLAKLYAENSPTGGLRGRPRKAERKPVA